jgi:hypothetical protein
MFLEFLGFSEESKLTKEKQKARKTIYMGELPTNRRRNDKSFWDFF